MSDNHVAEAEEGGGGGGEREIGCDANCLVLATIRRACFDASWESMNY